MANITVSTSTLKTITGLMIVPQNISKYVQRSQVIQITVDSEHNLIRFNAESANIVSEAKITGTVSGSSESMFVDSIVFRNLVGTLIHDTTQFSVTNDHVSVIDGTAQYIIDKVADTADGEFNHPRLGEWSINSIDPSEWEFIKSHMLFAAADPETTDKPVYRYVYRDSAGTVLTGDFFRSIFATYKCQSLGGTYLIPQSVVHAFCAIPDKNAAYAGADYITVMLNESGMSYTAEHRIETENNIGSYNADIFMPLFGKDSDQYISVKSADVLRVLGQADIVSGKFEEFITVSIESGKISFSDSRITCTLECDDALGDVACVIYVSKAKLKSAVSACPSKTIQFSVTTSQDGRPIGLCVSGGEVYYVIGISDV